MNCAVRIQKILFKGLISCLFLVTLASCNKEGQMMSMANFGLSPSEYAQELNSSSAPEQTIKQAMIVGQQDKDLSDYFVNTTPLSMSETKNIKLICILDSLNTLGFAINNYTPDVTIKDKTLYVSIHEPNELTNYCESAIKSKNLNFKLAKIGIRYHARDFELKPSPILKLDNLKITSDYIDSLQTPQVQVQLLCPERNDNTNTVFLAKPYFNLNMHKQNNILFVYLDIDTVVQNRYNFYACKNHLKGKVVSPQNENFIFENVYFIGNSIEKSDYDKFFIENEGDKNKIYQDAALVCTYLDKEKKLHWHWGYHLDESLKIKKISGLFKEGIFYTNEDKENIENICKESYLKFDKNWELLNIGVAEYFWSWGSPISFLSSSKLTNSLPFQKMIVFGPKEDDNGSSKKIMGSISSRTEENRAITENKSSHQIDYTLFERLSHEFNVPLFNWAGLKMEHLNKQMTNDNSLSDAVELFLKESLIWGGSQKMAKTLFILDTRQNKKNMEKDLESALNKLIEQGAMNFNVIYDSNSKKSVEKVEAEYKKQIHFHFANVDASQVFDSKVFSTCKVTPSQETNEALKYALNYGFFLQCQFSYLKK